MRLWIGPGLEIVERGALDGLRATEIADLAPRRNEHRFITRLTDGSEVVVGKRGIRDRVQRVVNELPWESLDFAVVLCTGHLPRLVAHGLLLESQTLVDHAVAAIAEGARSVGVMLPLAEQLEEFRFRGPRKLRVRLSHANPYAPQRLEQAARELSRTDLIVMHCIGYTDAMRRAVASSSGKPVLLARRLVAAAVSQLV